MQTIDNTSGKPQNRGFTLHMGDTYLGFLTIGEFDRNGKRVIKQNTADGMATPEGMQRLLDSGAIELRPYAEKEVADTSDIDSILAGNDAPSVDVDASADSDEDSFVEDEASQAQG